MKTVVVYGPQGCGKTTHAYELMKKHGCTILLDDWDGHAPLQPGTLALTHEPPPYQVKADEVWSVEACHEGCSCSGYGLQARRLRLPFTTQFVNLDCLSNHLNPRPEGVRVMVEGKPREVADFLRHRDTADQPAVSGEVSIRIPGSAKRRIVIDVPECDDGGRRNWSIRAYAFNGLAAACEIYSARSLKGALVVAGSLGKFEDPPRDYMFI